MRISLLATLFALSAATAYGQDAGAVVGASVGATNLASRTELTFTGAAGYRFNRVVGLEIEVTAVPRLHSAFPTSDGGFVIQATPAVPSSISSSVLIYPPPTFSSSNGRAVIFTNNVRVDLPTTTGVLTPYFVAGGGVGSIRRSAELTYPYPVPLAGAPSPIPVRLIAQPVSSSETDLALTLGGGVGVRVTSHVSIDGDVRFFRLFGNEDTNAGRFAVGARYRF